jgi:hypothetical protein
MKRNGSKAHYFTGKVECMRTTFTHRHASDCLLASRLKFRE